MAMGKLGGKQDKSSGLLQLPTPHKCLYTNTHTLTIFALFSAETTDHQKTPDMTILGQKNLKFSWNQTDNLSHPISHDSALLKTSEAIPMAQRHFYIRSSFQLHRSWIPGMNSHIYIQPSDTSQIFKTDIPVGKH